GPDLVRGGAPAGVGHQGTHREVRARVGQRTTARPASGTTRRVDLRQVFRIAVRVVTEQQRGVEYHRVAVAAQRVSAAVVHVPLRTLEQARVGGRVLIEQRRGRIEQVDR